MKKSAIAAVVLVAFAAPVLAQQMKPENQVKFRRAAYQLMNLNFDNLEAMADDKKPVHKPFAGGILSQTSGKPGETIQETYDNEVVKERTQRSGSRL